MGQPGGACETAERVRQAVARFQAGIEPEQSFRVLVELFYRPVKGFFARRVGSFEEANDLTQDTFLRVYKGLGAYRAEAQFSTWLFRIAHHVWLSRASRARPAAEVLLPVGGDDAAEVVAFEGHGDEWDLVLVARDDTPLEVALKKERRQLLKASIAELPGQMRRCVMLRVGQGLSYREIATVMQLSIDTVKVHLFRARERLGRSLGNGAGLPTVSP